VQSTFRQVESTALHGAVSSQNRICDFAFGLSRTGTTAGERSAWSPPLPASVAQLAARIIVFTAIRFSGFTAGQSQTLLSDPRAAHALCRHRGESVRWKGASHRFLANVAPACRPPDRISAMRGQPLRQGFETLTLVWRVAGLSRSGGELLPRQRQVRLWCRFREIDRCYRPCIHPTEVSFWIKRILLKPTSGK